jgi:hypothetical protein
MTRGERCGLASSIARDQRAWDFVRRKRNETPGRRVWKRRRVSTFIDPRGAESNTTSGERHDI